MLALLQGRSCEQVKVMSIPGSIPVISIPCTGSSIVVYIRYGYQMIKGYCTSLRINCGMAKLLAQARACEGLLASDLAIPQLIFEQVQINPIIIYLLLHF